MVISNSEFLHTYVKDVGAIMYLNLHKVRLYVMNLDIFNSHAGYVNYQDATSTAGAIYGILTHAIFDTIVAEEIYAKTQSSVVSGSVGGGRLLYVTNLDYDSNIEFKNSKITCQTNDFVFASQYNLVSAGTLSHGPAIYIGDDSSQTNKINLDMHDNEFCNCYGAHSGAVLKMSPNVASNLFLYDNTFTMNSALNGGAVYTKNVRFASLLRNVFEDNLANNGGDMYIEDVPVNTYNAETDFTF